MNIYALMNTFGSFEGLAKAILREQGFEDLTNEEIDSFFESLDDEDFDEVYASVFNLKIEIENVFTELEKVLEEKDI